MTLPSALSFWIGSVLPALLTFLLLARHIISRRERLHVESKQVDEARLPAWRFIFREYVTEEHIDELEAELEVELEAERVAAGEATTAPTGSEAASSETQPLLGAQKRRILKLDRPRLRTTLGLSAIGTLEAFAWLAYLIYSLVERSYGHGDLLLAVLSVTSWSYAALCPLVRPTITPPFDLLLLYSLHFLGAIITAYSYVADRVFRHQSASHIELLSAAGNLSLCLAALAIVVSMPLEKRIRPVGRDSEGYLATPEDYVTLFDWLTFRWINELIAKGLATTLEDKDVYALSAGLKSRLLLKRFFVVSPAERPTKSDHTSESTYGATNGNGTSHAKISQKKVSLLYRLFRANAHDMVIDFVLTLIAAVLSYASPFFLKRILDAIEASAQDIPPSAPQALFSMATFDTLVRGGTATRETAYLFAIFAFLASLLKSQIDLQRLCYSRRAATRVRAELVMLIYDKALRKKDIRGALAAPEAAAATGVDVKKKRPQKQESEAAADVGKVVSLMAVDAQRAGQAPAGLYMIYSSPVEIIIATSFLLSLLGPSALLGYLCILIATPLQTVLARRAIKLAKSMSAARDKRMSVLSEVIAGLKFLKYFGTLHQWSERVLESRERELHWILQRQINNAYTMTVWIATPALFTVACFGSYTVLFGHELDAATGFTAIALFGMLRGPLSILPIMITDLLNTHVALKRIEAFLEEDEVPSWVCTKRTDAHPATPLAFDRRIICENATFRWRKTAPPPDATAANTAPKPSLLSRVGRKLHLVKSPSAAVVATQPTGSDISAVEEASEDELNKPFELRNVTLKPPPGKMTLVAGPTGCGKSTLLASLLGEVDLIEGTLQTPKYPFNIDPQSGLLGSIAYCAQQPWLLQASIKDNIVFGSAFDESRYLNVLECCALNPDLEILIDGDRTEIGERGVSLSGGQKARVALARAVYSRSATVLMDDVLAAVDSHTAEKITRECLSGPLMQGRTVLLVTHHVNLVLPSCAWVILLDQGEIAAQGTVESLRESGKLDALASIAEEEVKEEIAEVEARNDDAEFAAAKVPELKGEAVKDDGQATQAASRGPAAQLIKAEKKESGAVKLSVYQLWLSAASYWFTAFVLFLLILYKMNDLAEKFWLSFWTSSYEHPSASATQPSMQLHRLFARHCELSVTMFTSATTFVTANVPLYRRWGFPPANENIWPYILGFMAIQMMSLVIWIGVSVASYLAAIRAGRILFRRMLNSVLRSTSRWLDQTPSGRTLNRFSKDVDSIDQSLQSSIRQVVVGIINLTFSVAVITWVLPGFSIVAVVMGVVYYQLARGYIACGRDLRRIESVTRSPIFSSFGELLDGIMTVRAYSQEPRFLASTEKRMDRTSSAYWLTWMTSRWLLFRFDCIGAACVLTASMLALSGSIPPGLAGIAITQSQALTLSVYWLSRFWTQLEQDGNSVERVSEMIHEVPQEAPAVIEGSRPPALWPAEGGIEISNLELRYAPELAAVLHGVSLSIRPREKIGVVGRTGSGKSTLALAFFRFVEYSGGSIVIDGVDVSKIGLDDLRSRLVIIPQDAVLFSGTIRNNLDPFNEHTDEECIHVLRQVQLYSTPGHSHLPSRRDSIVDGIDSHFEPVVVPAQEADAPVAPASGSQTPRQQQSSISLDTVVADAGGNFSAGQRQLLAVARAMLRKSRVVICDEMSSAIDFHTDTILQQTMSEAFEDSTVLTIAHRLSTVASTSDRVLVLDRGKVVEFDSPHTLLEDEGSIFYGMCKKSGELDSLRQAAAETARKRGQRGR